MLKGFVLVIKAFALLHAILSGPGAWVGLGFGVIIAVCCAFFFMPRPAD